MERAEETSLSYWQLLQRAEEVLDQGDFVRAEQHYFLAAARRERSPGKVFFSEKLIDGLGRLLRRDRSAESGPAPGRWQRRSEAFTTRYLVEAETVVREGLRLAELRPEDDAERNQPILSSALFLVARSRLFEEEPMSAVPLLKGLFRTAGVTGQPFDVNLVRHDLPLTEEDRLWLARRGTELLEAFVASDQIGRGSHQAEEWAQVFLQLLQPRYFGSTERLEEERCWLEAVTADRLLGRAAASVDLYAAYLAVSPEPGPRADEARIRLLELYANAGGMHFPVPRYAEALGALQSAGLAQGSALTGRYADAVDIIEFRRPEERAVPDEDLAWASLAVEPDGRVATVYWWGAEPRDVAFWRPEHGLDHLEAFLAPCAGRLVAADAAVGAAVAGLWSSGPAPWSVRDYSFALLEHLLPAGGPDHDFMIKLGLGETEPWRRGWRASAGHPDLEPPRSSTMIDAWQSGPASGAVLAGLLWLALGRRVNESDPSLRAGIAELSRRGDPAATFLYRFLIMGDEAARALDAGFEAWTLPLLWTRPDPGGWGRGGRQPSVDAGGGEQDRQRPDLSRNALAIVSTGDPVAVMNAWGEGRQKWRLVLDRRERLTELSGIASRLAGPVTIIPGDGRVHDLDEGLHLLDDLSRSASRPSGPVDGLLPLFHWLRLTETHNGDLLDFLAIRHRGRTEVELFRKYVELVASIGRAEPRRDDEDGSADWGHQFSQRVRKAGLVVGSADQLLVEDQRLDSLWGVFPGSDASWVFLDSAAIHWDLLDHRHIDIRTLHARLFERGGRHLSLLGGSSFGRTDLEDLLGTWLDVFGTAYCLSLTDTRPPLLKLADRGLSPAARLQQAAAMAIQATYVTDAMGQGPTVVQVPRAEGLGRLWADLLERDAAADCPQRGDGSDADLEPGAGRLIVTALHSLDLDAVPLPEGDTPAAWRQADRRRRDFLAERRKLMHLELAALQARSCGTVEVLDTRWWRLLRPSVMTGDSDETWSGERALAAAGGENCRIFDLPLPDRDTQARVSALRDRIARRLAESTRTSTREEAVASGPDLPPPGVHLFLGRGTDPWPALVRWLTLGWEAGDLGRWLLLVTDEPPTGAAEVVAAAGVDGATAWPPEQDDRPWGPVVWARPRDLSDTRLIQRLEKVPPQAILAGDLAAWLPTEGHDGQLEAVALRRILHGRAERVFLRAESLAETWTYFFSDVCQARINLHGPLETTAPARTTAPPVADEAATAPAAGTVDRPRPEAACGFALAPLSEHLGFNPGWGEVRQPQLFTRRLQALVVQIRHLLDDAADQSDTRLVPLIWLGVLAGVLPRNVATALRLLRWMARLAGDTLTAVDLEIDAADRSAVAGHSLLLGRRLAELEHELDELTDHVALLLPLWQTEAGCGSATWIDLATPPAEISAEQLQRVDHFLLLLAADLDSPPVTPPVLTYACPRGALHTTQRLLGFPQGIAAAIEHIRRHLEIFRQRLADVYDSAVETGDGFLVETGLSRLRPDEESFITLGTVLGFWRWCGPASATAAYQVDLLSLADCPTVAAQASSWSLVARLYEESIGTREIPSSSWPRRSAPVLAPGSDEEPRWTRHVRALLPSSERDDDLRQARRRIKGLVEGDTASQLLVLRGLAGTGRHRVVLEGLFGPGRSDREIPEITFYCPDRATAALITSEATAQGLAWPLDIRIPGRGDPVSGLRRSGRFLADLHRPVVVMCEIQRFEPELRYRIAQSARGGCLVMTVDVAATAEPWENLFLTTPRADDVVVLERQQRLTRQLWTELRQLVPEAQRGDAASRRKEKGQLQAAYAANLDQGLAHIYSEYEAQRLPDRLRLVAALESDLEYLGASLRSHGWLALSAEQLESMLLPGAMEFLAAVTDVLAAAGYLNRFFAGQAADPQDRADDNEPDVTELEGRGESLLRCLLDDVSYDRWLRWCADRDLDMSRLTVRGFLDLIAEADWASHSLAQPASQRRVRALVEAWGDEPLTGLVESTSWEAWWYTARDLAGLTGPAACRPLVQLTTATAAPGPYVAGGIYLCLGTETAASHYRVMNRVTDGLLVLFQERSPLPSQTTE